MLTTFSADSLRDALFFEGVLFIDFGGCDQDCEIDFGGPADNLLSVED